MRLRDYAGQELTPRLCATIARGLNLWSDKGVNPANVYGTLMLYGGDVLTRPLVRLIATQLAGRLSDLLRGPLHRTQVVPDPTWCAAQIMDIPVCPWKDGRAGRRMRFRVFYGLLAGHTVDCIVPETYLRRLAYHVGFSRRITYDDDPRHFIGLQCWVYLEGADDAGNRVIALDVNSRFSRANRNIIKCRKRFDIDLDVDPCPHHYDHACWQCAAIDCPAVVARYTQWSSTT